tara:strand:+ start:94 stop:651 length:558 start_codon:yes stop_codon:yes gene_type:complete
MSLTSYINSNQENLIELLIDFDELNANGLISGTIDNFSVSFPQTINLNSNSDYDIGVEYVLFSQPYPTSQDSYFLYCSLCEQSRVGSDVANVLHKTLTAYSTSLPENDGNYVFSKSTTSNTIIDWKKLNVKDFSTIDFIFKSSSGIAYPIGILPITGTTCNLVIKVIIRQSPTSKGMTQKLLGRY